MTEKGPSSNQKESEEEILRNLGLKKGQRVTFSENFWDEQYNGKSGIITGIDIDGDLVFDDESGNFITFLKKRNLTEEGIKENFIIEEPLGGEQAEGKGEDQSKTDLTPEPEPETSGPETRLEEVAEHKAAPETSAEKEPLSLLKKDEEISKEEKIKHLGLSYEDTEKFDEIQKEADKYKEGSKEISKSFLNIEGFSFDEEGADTIAREMTHAFVRGRLEAGGFPSDITEKAVDIIMCQKELKNQEQEKTGEKQKILEKAYEQILKQKERFIQTLEKLEFSEKQADDLLFMKDKIEDIEVILGIDLTTGSIGMPIINKMEAILKKRDDLIDVFKKIDDKSFINNFEAFEKTVNEFKETASLFFSGLENNLNIPSDIKLILSFEKESFKNNPEVSEKVSKEITQLLDHFGYRSIYPVKGEEYDPRAHEAVGEEISEFKRGKIVRVAKRGLKRGDTVISKAEVVIAK